MGERAERGVVLGDDAVDEGRGVAAADLEVRREAAEGALEVIADVEGDAAGGETVGLVACGCGDEAGELVLEVTWDELGVEAEDDVAEFAALVDELRVGLGVGGAALGEAVHVDGDGGVDGEDVVEAVADGGSGEGRPAGDGVVDAGEGGAGVPAMQRIGEAGDVRESRCRSERRRMAGMFRGLGGGLLSYRGGLSAERGARAEEADQEDARRWSFSGKHNPCSVSLR